MTEAEWLACVDPAPMLEFLRDKASNRKLRLFACALARYNWDLLSVGRARIAVEAAERFADGMVPKKEMTAAGAAAQQAAWVVSSTGPRFKGHQIAAAFYAARDSAYDVARAAAAMTSLDATRAGVDTPLQVSILRDIVGPLPFHPVTIPAVLVTPAALAIAGTIYNERRFEDLPVLADALEEAGCIDANVLGHCRGDGGHVRGCWVVDAVLGQS